MLAPFENPGYLIDSLAKSLNDELTILLSDDLDEQFEALERARALTQRLFETADKIKLILERPLNTL